MTATSVSYTHLAIPTMDDIRLISAIKNEVDIPLVADIQFDYRLAIAAVKAGIDKVRINPGNIGAVSYTHLDVYKRQTANWSFWRAIFPVRLIRLRAASSILAANTAPISARW